MTIGQTKSKILYKQCAVNQGKGVRGRKEKQKNSKEQIKKGQGLCNTLSSWEKKKRKKNTNEKGSLRITLGTDLLTR